MPANRGGASKYDYVKVRVWLQDAAHYYVLSLFLVSRALAVTQMAYRDAIRLALELVGRSDDPAQTAALALRVEQRIATLAPQQEGYRIVVTQFLRSRVERRRRAMRAVLLEYRFSLLETE